MPVGWFGTGHRDLYRLTRSCNRTAMPNHECHAVQRGSLSLSPNPQASIMSKLAILWETRLISCLNLIDIDNMSAKSVDITRLLQYMTLPAQSVAEAKIGCLLNLGFLMAICT